MIDPDTLSGVLLALGVVALAVALAILGSTRDAEPDTRQHPGLLTALTIAALLATIAAAILNATP